MNRKNLIFLAVVLVIIAMDQSTKWWVETNLAFRTDDLEIIPGFFSLVHAQNRGAALGILRNFEFRIFLFIGFTIVAVVIIVNMQRQLEPKLRFLPTVLGLICGGALGNGIDRVTQGWVTDFLRVYTEHPGTSEFLISWFGTAEYPSFNVADSALVVGVGLFIVHYLFLDEGELDSKKPKDVATATPGPGEGPTDPGTDHQKTA
ncbi:MAG: signal peptidase II [Deltaproteobacteria bacterium]|nr:signal peptidase II [Deltaproteobacteria bacterium]MBW2254037.1 signal peptidase II [Deltaproteobacteria bacterium]